MKDDGVVTLVNLSHSGYSYVVRFPLEEILSVILENIVTETTSFRSCIRVKANTFSILKLSAKIFQRQLIPFQVPPDCAVLYVHLPRFAGAPSKKGQQQASFTAVP